MDAKTACLLIGIFIGTVIGAVINDILRVQPAERKARVYEMVMDDTTRRLRQVNQTQQHLGTPYLDLAGAERYGVKKQPGIRVVEGHELYSSDWLSDDRGAA